MSSALAVAGIRLPSGKFPAGPNGPPALPIGMFLLLPEDSGVPNGGIAAGGVAEDGMAGIAAAPRPLPIGLPTAASVEDAGAACCDDAAPPVPLSDFF